MKKRIRNSLIWLTVLVYLVVVSGFISEKHAEQLIHTIAISILDQDVSHFIDEPDVREILHASRIPILGQRYETVNCRRIEEKLQTQQIIRKAEVYVAEPGVLHIDIEQREPFVRIFNSLGQSYYFDREGNIIPASRSFSPFVLVVSGSIREPFGIRQVRNLFDFPHDSLSYRSRCIYDIFKLAAFIAEDDFWSAQIQQIFVNSSGEFELIPRVGSQVIELGRADQLEEKFYKLKLLYLQGFNQLGWNYYARINLKYENQVVCIKN